MNYIDLLLLLVLGISTWHGYKKGFLETTSEIIIWLGSFLAAFFLSKYIAQILINLFDASEIWMRGLSFILCLVFFSWLISTLADQFVSRFEADTLNQPLNRISGLIPGLFSGLVYAAMISFFLQAYSVGSFSEEASESRIVTGLTNRSGGLGKKITETFYDFGMKLSSGMTIHPKGKEIVNLPFKVNSFNVRHDLELKMLDLLNEERAKKGLKLLSFDEKLAQVARKHCSDMFSRSYFSHFTPEGKSPFDRIREGKISFISAGENLALAQNLKLAHEGLMNSPTHKANILHRTYNRVGIGILDGGIHGIIITQNFRN